MATKKAAAPAPGVPTEAPTHRVLYMQREPNGAWHPVASYQAGDKAAEAQGEHVFAATRSKFINQAVASAAVLPEFLEQTERGGFKVED